MTTPDGRGPLAITRRARVLDALHDHGTLRVTELSRLVGVTPVTVRRDIAQLASEGLVHRVHGGVTLAAPDPDEPAPATPEATGLRTIGMLVPSLDYYWPDVVRGAEEAARAGQFRVVLRGSSYQADDTKAQLAHLIEQVEVSGLVLAPNLDAPHTGEALEWLASTGIPVVLIERTATVGPHHDVVESVVTDHALGAGLAVRHLVSLGHRTVGLVVNRRSPHGPKLRQGWLEAGADCGFDPGATVDVTVPGPASPQWQPLIEDLLDRCRATGTTALLVHADAEAIALIQRCEARGLQVPGDLSVVAYDDEVAALFSPPLTAIRPPREALGRAAVALVAARLADPERPAHRIVISPSLRVRESSGPPPG
jgi:DNA-binding LacI/PurR family transcriptional regulator